MAETAWSEEAAPPPPKKKVPTWIWFCGGGCLALVILGALLVGLGFKFFKSSTDPEVQWPKVAEILPFDERPPELELQFGNDVGFGIFFFTDSRGFMAILMHAPAGDQQMRKQIMSEDFSGSVFGQGGRKNMKAGTVTVQGRTLDVLRYYHLGSDDGGGDAGAGGAGGGSPQVGKGAAVNVDVTPENSNRGLFLQLIRAGANGDTPVTDEEIRTFLKPFHVGSER